jgi:uncharacterized membrane protein (DUF373 family)
MSQNPSHQAPQARPDPHEAPRHPILTAIISILGSIEDIILTGIALLLIVLAVLLLINGGLGLVRAVVQSDLSGLELDILESILLVAVIMEIVYTVMLSLRSHELSAEPFLVVGVIAAIRRILEITIKSSSVDSSGEAFRGLLYELGLLAVIVVALAISIFIVRRSQGFLMKLPSVVLAETSKETAHSSAQSAE